MKTAFHILVSLISMILLFSSGANAYKGQTHRDITNQAIQYLGEEDEYSLVCTNIATLIADGSVEEDNPLLTLRSWFHYSPTLYSLYALATCDAITWAFEPGLCFAWTPVRWNILSNDFNWQIAVDEAGTDSGWTALGHVVHLLEDLAVPAHTRNDPHPIRDPLEHVAKAEPGSGLDMGHPIFKFFYHFHQ